MSNHEDYMLINISKWLNQFVSENKINVEEMSKRLDYSIDYINVLLDYSYQSDLYEKQNINVPLDFIVKLAKMYNVKVDEFSQYIEFKD